MREDAAGFFVGFQYLFDYRICYFTHSRIRKLHRKTGDLVSRQHSDSRKLTTRRKADLFAEAVARFEATLNLIENAHPASKNVDNNKLVKETRTLNMDALRKRADRELENRKRQLLPALALRGKQQGQKSGATHIQSHVGSVTRRKQTMRDAKNR